MIHRIDNFRFWCQKVLPTVYDDSLSYYELLCKVVAKLNETIDESNSLYDAFLLLKEYVDHYFDSHEIETLIEQKLNEMVEDGTFANLINQELLGDINDRLTEAEGDIDDLEDCCETVQGDIRNLVSELSDVSSDIRDIQGYLETDESDIADLKSAMQDAQHDIDQLEEDMENAKGDIDDLEDAVEDILDALDSAGQRNLTVAFLHCDDAYTDDNARGYSLCVVLHNENICIVYDLGNDTDAATLVGYLRSKNITKVDAAIISHYHSDHVSLSRVNGLMNYCTVTKWYLPHYGMDWNSYVGTGYSTLEGQVKSAITTAGSSWVQPDTEGYTVDLDDAKIRFFNVVAQKFTGYYAYLRDEDMNVTNHTNYNNFSMIASIDCGGRRCVLTGDIEKPAEEKNKDVIVGADIMLIPHHGLNLAEDYGFMENITAKISVAAAYGVARTKRLTIAAAPVPYRCGEVGAALSTLNKSVYCNLGTAGVWADEQMCGTPINHCELGEIIPPNSNFNDYKDVGRQYYIQNASVGATIVANSPSGAYPYPTSTSAGRLFNIPTNQNTNFDDGSFFQIFIPYFSYAHPEIAIRMFFDGQFKTWQHIEFEAITD